MDESSITRFRSPIQLAEVATAGVEYNLAVGDDLAAAALQQVARAAWGLVDDPDSSEELATAAHDAELSLQLACGMVGERQFLSDVLDFVADGPADADNDATEPHTGLPTLPDPDDVDLVEAQRVGSAAAEYLRAAAALSEVAVMFRVAGTAVELNACGAEEIVGGVIARVPAVLEQAAEAYTCIVTLLSRSDAAESPELAQHLRELRIGVRALTGEAMRLSDDVDGDHDPVEDSEDAEDVATHHLIDFFTDRAETFRAKSEFMATCAELAATQAWGLASE